MNKYIKSECIKSVGFGEIKEQIKELLLRTLALLKEKI